MITNKSMSIKEWYKYMYDNELKIHYFEELQLYIEENEEDNGDYERLEKMIKELEKENEKINKIINSHVISINNL